jgi:hypothetical protein
MAEVQIGNISVEVETGLSNDTLTAAHTADPGTDLMLVAVAIADERDVTLAEWNGVAMNEVINFSTSDTGVNRLIVYSVVAPTGSHDVVVTVETTPTRFCIQVINFTGVNQADPIDLSTIQTQHEEFPASEVKTAKKIKAPFVFDCMIVGLGPQGAFTLATPTENNQIPLDGRANGDANAYFSASGAGCSYKAGNLGKDVNTNMGWEHGGLNHDWAHIAFALNAGEEEIEFIGGPLGLTEHLQVPGRNRSM